MREVLERHQRICDDLYQLALEENRYLLEKKRTFGAELLERRQALLDQLATNLDALKQAITPAPGEAREMADLKEKVRQRILQCIHLDRDNEKLILRYSLQSRGGPAATLSPAAPPPAGNIARLYGKVMPPRAG
ncbi:MAG TPA: hypothetical protein PK322_03180 [Opitutaceae bacterium]|nr:hypothetical protein [Opitutaceae bacterium]